VLDIKTPIQLIVGLGNPGSTYADTRHNAGTWFIEAFCEQNHLTLKTEAKFNARLTQVLIEGRSIRIMLPNTYMNHSGRAVVSVANHYQIPVNTILVAHDELDIPVGTLRFKTGGGHGGHNGVRDIIHHLGSPEFYRLRIGIGRPIHQEDAVHNHVLSKPSLQDKQQIRMAIAEAITMLPQVIMGDFQSVMNRLHVLGVSI